MRFKRLFIASVAIFSIIFVMATYAGAAYYNGRDIDGIVFDGAIYLLDPEGEPVKAVFSGYLVTIYWEDGETSNYLLESMEIEFPWDIELFTDPDEPQPLINPILEIFL